jgi:hypothetical protein
MKAAFILQQEHVDRAKIDEGFRLSLAQYHLIVCNANLDVGAARNVCQRWTKLGGYIHHDGIPTYGQADYWQDYRELFADPDWYFLDGQDQPIVTKNFARLRPHLDAMEAKVDWIAERIAPRFDFTYVDMLVRGYSPWLIRDLGLPAEELPVWQEAKSAALTFFLRYFRRRLPLHPIIGNTWGANRLPYVSGQGIEHGAELLSMDQLSLLHGITIESPGTLDLPYLMKARDCSQSRRNPGDTWNVGWYSHLSASELVMPGVAL